MKKYTIDQLARMVDHTYVKAYATKEQMKKLCDEALQYHFAMTAINSGQTAFCKDILKGTDIHVGAAIAFPLGQMSIEAKVLETIDALKNGADEIDYTINITEVKDANWAYVEEEMDQIVKASHAGNAICKVILETSYLTKEEIVKICEIAKKVKIDFVKTSTGFSDKGATVEDIALMKKTVGNEVHVKASGGIRDAATFKEMVAHGAERIGTSAGVKIIAQFKEEMDEEGYIYIEEKY